MVDRPTILSESHRQSSFSSTTSNTDQDHSPLDSPNGSVASVGHSQIDFSQKLNMKIGDTMEFHYMDEYESDGNISGEPPPDQKFTTTKRDIHTINEQRRRDQIKQGYAHLMDIVPTCHPSSSGNKPSRAVILQRSIEYITYLQNQSIKQKDKEDDLEKEVQALRIMKENYEQIARAHQSTTSQGIQQVPDHVKFLVFRGIADQLFASFNSSISVTSFDTLSSCIISWLEEYCKPQTLREIVLANLRQVDAMKFSGLPPTLPQPSRRTN